MTKYIISLLMFLCWSN